MGTGDHKMTVAQTYLDKGTPFGTEDIHMETLVVAHSPVTGCLHLMGCSLYSPSVPTGTSPAAYTCCSSAMFMALAMVRRTLTLAPHVGHTLKCSDVRATGHLWGMYHRHDRVRMQFSSLPNHPPPCFSPEHLHTLLYFSPVGFIVSLS